MTGRRLGQWWLDRSVGTKGLTVIAIPLIALIASTSTTLILQQDQAHQRSLGRAAGALSTAANQVLADAVNGETGVRGYAATRDALFLEPYNLTLTRIDAERATLRNAAAAEGEVGQERVVDATVGQVLIDLSQLRQAASTGVSIRHLVPQLKAGKSTMDRLRRQVANLAAGPALVQLAERNKVTTLQSKEDDVDIASLILGLLAGLAGVALFTTGISRRVATNAANAIRLGEGQPLEPVRPSGDEIGKVADSHRRAHELLATRAAELTAARDAAVTATHAKNVFLSSTSHELRTPLNSILGFTQLLEMSDLSEDDRDSTRRILGAGRYLLGLINDLIDVARIESGDLGLSLELVPLHPLVEKISQLMSPLAKERSISIVLHFPAPGLAAHADRQRLIQILVNLISNAIKYNRRGGTITIGCVEHGADRVSVVVTDTGRGLEPLDLERIFIPFERLGAERSGAEGTGIGLPLARALAEAMGGGLTASSVPGVGSTFTVTLARAADTVLPQVPLVPPITAIRPRVVGLAGSSLNILYIEDNAANIALISRYLDGVPGVTLQAVRTGQAGIARALRDRPDVILLDVHLDDISGEEVLRELKTDPITSAIPVVVLSAEARAGFARRLIAGGALAYLTKPLDLDALGQLLSRFVSAGVDPQADPATPIGPI